VAEGEQRVGLEEDTEELQHGDHGVVRGEVCGRALDKVRNERARVEGPVRRHDRKPAHVLDEAVGHGPLLRATQQQRRRKRSRVRTVLSVLLLTLNNSPLTIVSRYSAISSRRTARGKSQLASCQPEESSMLPASSQRGDHQVRGPTYSMNCSRKSV
jgi:hypothetical protein